MSFSAGAGPVISPAELARSPAWFPLDFEAADAVRLLQLDEAAYCSASFLDQRLLHLNYARATLATTVLRSAAALVQPRLHYLFHTGHVGSTLLSRLIGAHPGFFSLREPALLRAAAEAASPAADVAVAGTAALPLPEVLALLSRTWRPTQHAVVKVSSFVSELADALLASSAAAAAIFVYATPLNYLRGILAGPNSRTESRHLAPQRLARLRRRLGAAGWHCDPRSEGEQVAMSWLCEMAALQQAAERHRARILWVNFDSFLAEPLAGLRLILHALGAAPSAAEVQALIAGPIMGRYSKAPEHAYDAQLRRAVLQSADQEHATEIRRGMEWLQQLAPRNAAVRGVLESLQARQGPI
jgi:hypothetical protein